MPVGCSGVGGSRRRQIVEASDVVLIHGNGQSRQDLHNLVLGVREWAPDKPVVCNEDSQALSQLSVCERDRVSWGYYNNLSKQEPPVDWGILPGEDFFFANRMARMLGIPSPSIAKEDQFCLQGFEKDMRAGKRRWPRLASLYPENVERVDFYRDGRLFYSCWNDPFTVRYVWNWLQMGVEVESGESWKASVLLKDGSSVEKVAICP